MKFISIDLPFGIVVRKFWEKMDSPLCGGVHPCSCGVINHGGSVSSGINEVVILFGSTKKVIYAKKFSTLNLNSLLDFFFC